MNKPHPVFESLGFNVVLSIVALVMLGTYLTDVITEGFTAGPTVRTIIWIVIAFHFVQKVYFFMRDKKNQ